MTGRSVQRTWLYAIALAFVSLSFWMGYLQGQRTFKTPALPRLAHSSNNMHRWKIEDERVEPKGFKIVGMMFFGRRQYVDILDCYLRRNLAVNAGLLDEVHFILHTSKNQDLEWLTSIIEKDNLEDYYKIKNGTDFKWNKLWEFVDEPDTMYIKIDDDILFVDDNAIPRIVRSLVEHPEAHSVQANTVNSFRTHWLHLHTDAIHAYLPEREEPSLSANHNTWKYSQLPPYQQDVPDKYDFEQKKPPKGHRWLPLKEDNADMIWRTPIRTSKSPDVFGRPIEDWSVGAQEHYSLLQNIEQDTLGLYWAGNSDGIWNMWYSHYSINFMAIWGRTILDHPFFDFPFLGDEWALTEKLPKDLAMPVKVDTRAIVAHYSYSLQLKGMARTDILDRYRALANERYCTAGNQKVPFARQETSSEHYFDGNAD